MTFLRRPYGDGPSRARNRRGAGAFLDPRSFFPDLWAVWRFYDPRTEINPNIRTVYNMPGIREAMIGRFGDPFDLVQTTAANQPVLNSTVWGGQLSAGVFDGVTSYMVCPALGAALAGNQQPLLVMLVAQVLNQGSMPIWLGTAAGASRPVQEIFCHNASMRYRCDKLDDAAGSVLNLETNTSFTFDRHILGWRHTGTAETLMQEGVPLAGLTNQPSVVGQCSFDTLWIGSRWNGSALFLPCNMNVREIWIGKFQTTDDRMRAASSFLESVNPLN